MQIFLAGSTGVLGRRMIPLLLADGHEVTALTRDPGKVPDLRAAGAVPVVGDVFDRRGLHQALAGSNAEVVVHQLTDLGAGGSSASNAHLRTEGTRNLVDAASAVGVRRIVAQSIAWAYEGGGSPADERTPLDRDAPEPRRTTVEGIVALEGAAAELPEWVVLRNGALYGPGTWFAADGARAHDARHRRLAADADITSFVHVDDAAQAAVAALSWPTGVVNVVDDEPAAGHDWVPAFCRAVRADPPLPSEASRSPWARGADNGLARRSLGLALRHPSWRQGFLADR